MAGIGNIKSGLSSVSCRGLKPPQIVRWCEQAGLAGVEWDGEGHVPHGDCETARRVGELTGEHGLAVVAYGSYYRVGVSERDGLTFAKVLETAVHLRAPLIRVWAGIKSSAAADAAYVNWIVEQSARIAGLAAGAGIRVAYECYADTLADNLPAIMSLLEKINRLDLRFIWQPFAGKTVADNLQVLRAVLPRLELARVRSGPDDAALPAEAAEWREYFNLLRADEHQRYVLLRFGQLGEVEQLRGAALTLRRWISASPGRQA